MSTMIERVARALDPYAWSEKSFSIRREVSKQQARAAIGAMREPTEAMLSAKSKVDFVADGEPDDIAEWKAMIDAALKEEA